MLVIVTFAGNAVDESDFIVVVVGVALLGLTVDCNGDVDVKGDFVEIEVDFNCSVSCKVVKLKVEPLLLTVVLAGDNVVGSTFFVGGVEAKVKGVDEVVWSS